MRMHSFTIFCANDISHEYVIFGDHSVPSLNFFLKMYHPTCSFLDDYFQQFDRLLMRRLPKIHQHLVSQGFSIPMYGIEWFTTLVGLFHIVIGSSVLKNEHLVFIVDEIGTRMRHFGHVFGRCPGYIFAHGTRYFGGISSQNNSLREITRLCSFLKTSCFA